MQKIAPFLWFNDNAEEAIRFYTSIFDDASVLDMNRGPDGKLFTATFQLAGQQFMALNGGPQFQFNEAISLHIRCEDQAEVDRLWEALLAGGGEESMCGWLKDRFGLSWQVIPVRLGALLSDPDPERAGRAMQAMLQMRKIDVAELERAANGG